MPTRTSEPLLPKWVAVAAAVVAVGALVVTLVLAVTGDDGEDRPGPAYAADVRGAFDDAGALSGALATGGRWADGDAPDEELASALDDADAVLPSLRDAVEAIDAPDGAATAARFYLASVDLYGLGLDAFRGALDADGDERTERSLLARRVRVLADRTYDRALVLVDPDADPAATPVPDWDALDLGPGPTLGAAGDHFETQAAESAVAGTEAGNRAGVQLLVLAEAERARVLGLEDLAFALELVASRMTGS